METFMLFMVNSFFMTIFKMNFYVHFEDDKSKKVRYLILLSDYDLIS